MSYKGNINRKLGFLNKPNGQPCYRKKEGNWTKSMENSY